MACVVPLAPASATASVSVCRHSGDQPPIGVVGEEVVSEANIPILVGPCKGLGQSSYEDKREITVLMKTRIVAPPLMCSILRSGELESVHQLRVFCVSRPGPDRPPFNLIKI